MCKAVADVAGLRHSRGPGRNLSSLIFKSGKIESVVRLSFLGGGSLGSNRLIFFLAGAGCHGLFL